MFMWSTEVWAAGGIATNVYVAVEICEISPVSADQLTADDTHVASSTLFLVTDVKCSMSIISFSQSCGSKLSSLRDGR